jgi:hypothetical protein
MAIVSPNWRIICALLIAGGNVIDSSGALLQMEYAAAREVCPRFYENIGF